MVDLAIGCLAKPFTADELHRLLALSEDILRGRETLRSKVPLNLTLYDPGDNEYSDEPTYTASNLSLKLRLQGLIANWVERKLSQ